MEKKSHKDKKKKKENALKDRSREVFSVVTFIAGLHEHLLKGDLQNKKIGSVFDIYLEIS